jgi:hypothetical protein
MFDGKIWFRWSEATKVVTEVDSDDAEFNA